MQSSYGGGFNLPFQFPGPGAGRNPFTSSGDIGKDFGLGGAFQNSFYALLAPYLKQFGGSAFGDWLREQGLERSKDQYKTWASANLAAGSGNPSSFIDFFQKQWNPAALFGAMPPRERSENPAAFSPFTRFLTR